jgi:hypothetical protein
MTMPFERTNAVKRTEKFLLDLCNPKVTPRIPKDIRRQASSLLKHFPSRYDMEIISMREDGNDPTKTYQVFGENKFMKEKVKVTMCDPPSGWKYGFPKAVPKEFESAQEFHDWLISEGYPENIINEMGESFYCSYWEQEVDQV